MEKDAEGFAFFEEIIPPFIYLFNYLFILFI